MERTCFWVLPAWGGGPQTPLGFLGVGVGQRGTWGPSPHRWALAGMRVSPCWVQSLSQGQRVWWKAEARLSCPVTNLSPSVFGGRNKQGQRSQRAIERPHADPESSSPGLQSFMSSLPLHLNLSKGEEVGWLRVEAILSQRSQALVKGAG